MNPFSYQIGSIKDLSYSYTILAQKGLNKTISRSKPNSSEGSPIIGYEVINMGTINDYTPLINFFPQKHLKNDLSKGIHVKKIDILDGSYANHQRIEITIMGNSEYEYVINNDSDKLGNKFLEGINVKGKHLQKQVEFPLKYYGVLPKKTLSPIVEVDKVFKKKATLYKDIVIPVEYMGEMPVRPKV